ncbi:hypothetical protein GCM10027454_09290 [Algoriphagus aestuariicola]
MQGVERPANSRRCRERNRLPDWGTPDGSASGAKSLEGFPTRDDFHGRDSRAGGPEYRLFYVSPRDNPHKQMKS